MCVGGRCIQGEDTHTYLPPTHIYLLHIYIFPCTHRQRERERERERERIEIERERERGERREDAETFTCTHICAAGPLILSEWTSSTDMSARAILCQAAGIQHGFAFCQISSFDRGTKREGDALCAHQAAGIHRRGAL
jgi:hypothetical protein